MDERFNILSKYNVWGANEIGFVFFTTYRTHFLGQYLLSAKMYTFAHS